MIVPDYLSPVFPQVKWVFIRVLDGRSLNSLSLVSRLYFGHINDPTIWQIKAQELGLDYLEAWREVKVFCLMDESQKIVYAFAKKVISPLFPTQFKQIPNRYLVKPSSILKEWPPSATVIAGHEWLRHQHQYVPYIAFSLVHRGNDLFTQIIIVNKTSKITDAMRGYLNRLYKGEPCGKWVNNCESSRREFRGHSQVVLHPPLHTNLLMYGDSLIYVPD